MTFRFELRLTQRRAHDRRPLAVLDEREEPRLGDGPRRHG